MPELQVAAELQVKTTPSAIYNNLSCSGNILAFGNQQECVTLRPLGAHKLPVPDADKAPLTFSGAFSVRERPVVVICSSICIQLWDAARDTLLARIPAEGGVAARSAALVEFGERLVGGFGMSDGSVVFYEFEVASFEAKVLTQIRAHQAAITSVSASTESPVFFASADISGVITLWSGGFQPIAVIPAVSATECCTSVQIAGPSMIVAAYGSGKIRVFSPTGEMRVEICAHSRWINAMTFHRTRMLLATAGDDSLVAVWALPTTENNGRASLVGLYRGKNALYTGVAFNPEGSTVTAAAFDCDKFVTLSVPA
eukprot:CAMPEP_0176441604 /NCGR_PEP_ID=MMETSP0127-20121128/21299_1 /TAXON_ID=938130 /ORGANISM="Platyophrya macrostoma, Strain WH" /LENGTH=312 /DNA_ID=CAMNT_0017826419 /DNA_START=93 /DNA_END=1031 /DNA_ORIENTATION=-